MTEIRLVATCWTLAGSVEPGVQDVSPFSVERRAEAAAAAGYHGMGFSDEDLKANISKLGTRGIRRAFDDAGLKFLEVQALFDWFADGTARARSDDVRRFMLDTAAELETDHIRVVGDLHDTGVSIERMAEEFHVLCEEAGQMGAFISLEVFPGSNIKELKTARRFLELADAPNGGLLIDIWHMFRGNVPMEDIAALPREFIKHVEFSDAAPQMQGTLLEDTRDHRLLPGEGAFDYPAFMAALDATGYAGPYGVEILSKAIRRMEPEEAARRSFDATMRQLTRRAQAA